MIEWVETNDGVEDEHELVAGTAWLFARAEHRNKFQRLFVDEAGQFALANAAASGLAAESIVLLGDPQQLPQVTQASHPASAGASVLEHLLDGESTIAPGRGVLLTENWRMHPDVCAFVSERSYDRKLHSSAACARARSTRARARSPARACGRSPSPTRVAARPAPRRPPSPLAAGRCSSTRRSPTASSLAVFALTLLKIADHRRHRPASRAQTAKRRPRVRAGER
jgi:RNA helicase